MGKLGLLCLPFEIVPGGWESYADLGKPGLADMHYTCGPLQCSSPLGSTSDEHCTSSRGNSLRRTQGLHDRGRPKSTIITWLLNNSWWKTMDCADPPACMPILQSARHHIGPPRRHIPEERCSGCSHTFACSCWLIFSIFFSFIHICIHIYIYIYQVQVGVRSLRCSASIRGPPVFQTPRIIATLLRQSDPFSDLSSLILLSFSYLLSS